MRPSSDLPQPFSISENGLIWGSPLAEEHFWRMVPDQYSRRDECIVKWVLAIGFVLWFITELFLAFVSKRRIENVVLSKEKINAKKTELLDEKRAAFLSTNDVLTAALARAARRCSLIDLVFNMRNQAPDCTDELGGNFIRFIALPTGAAKDPHNVRHCVNSGSYYGQDQIPVWPFLTCSKMTITNWAALATFLPADVVCHTPDKAFFRLPFDLCIVYKVNREETAVVHNIRALKGHNSTLLRQITSS